MDDTKQLLTYTKHLMVDSPIYFMLHNNKEVVGIVHEVNICLDAARNCIWYEVMYLGDLLKVDGETYRQMK